MFPLHPSLPPQSEGIDENSALSSLKYKLDLDRRLPLQMQMEQYKQSLARSDLVNDAERLPVIRRWVPPASQMRPQNLSGLDTMNPRIIHATGNGITFSKNERPIDPSHLLTGAELLEARKLLHESSKLAPQTNEALLPLHQKLHQTANQDGGLEAAKMLLNMVESSNAKEKLASSSQKSPNSKTKSTAKAKNNGKVSASNTVSPIQDEYLHKWMPGVISLHTPEDDDVLSPLHCFMRRYCVEAFSATEEDVATPRYGKSHGFKVTVGQVGIRCLHCKHLPLDKRAERAVCYPSSLKNIYHSIETWQRRHSSVCTHITPWVRKSIIDLMEKSKTRAGGRRQYWEDSARCVLLQNKNVSHSMLFRKI